MYCRAHPVAQTIAHVAVLPFHPKRRRWTPYLTSRDVLEYLSLPSFASLYWQIRHNGLPAARVRGRLRFEARAVDDWVRAWNAGEIGRARTRR